MSTKITNDFSFEDCSDEYIFNPDMEFAMLIKGGSTEEFAAEEVKNFIFKFSQYAAYKNYKLLLSIWKIRTKKSALRFLKDLDKTS